MDNAALKSKGWYLGLPYMQRECLEVLKLDDRNRENRDYPTIFCDDILLNSPEWAEYLFFWLKSLKLGERLILWISDCRYIEPPHGAQRLTLDDLVDALKSVCELKILDKAASPHDANHRLIGSQAHNCILEADVIDGHAFVVAEKTEWNAPRQHKPWRKAKKHLLVCRTGAFGDALMAASVLPELKKQGYYITFLTRAKGHEALRHDPHIDEFLVLGTDKLQDYEHGAFYSAWLPRFDRAINLNQTIESVGIIHPSRTEYWWPEDQRRAMYGRSYLSVAHRAAQVPGPYRVKFYPTESETAWAKQMREKTGRVILWVLQGSAIHKWWPHTSKAICQLLRQTKFQFVLCGDATAADLAYGITQDVLEFHGDASRLFSLVNAASIRHAMAFAQHADIVIGPETGILNAISQEKIHKICMLSHSAPSNLTDDWINAIALKPTAPCFPCHRMHYSHDHCPQDQKTGAAVCAASISVKSLVDAVQVIDAKLHVEHFEKKIADGERAA